MSGGLARYGSDSCGGQTVRTVLSVFRGCRVMSHIYFPWAPPHNRRVVLPFA